MLKLIKIAIVNILNELRKYILNVIKHHFFILNYYILRSLANNYNHSSNSM